MARGWNEDILGNPDLLDDCMEKEMDEWLETFFIDLSPVYKKVIKYNKSELIIKEEEEDYEEEFDQDEEAEDGEDNDEIDEEAEELDWPFKYGYSNKEFEDEDIAFISNMEEHDNHLNLEFILALVEFSGMSLTKANNYYTLPSIAEPEEIKILNWANEILDMIYVLIYKFESISDPKAKEEIDNIKLTAAEYMGNKTAEGIIDQLLNLIESIVTDRADFDFFNYDCIN